MTTLLVVLHVLVSVFLIAVVLLQRGRGAEIGAVFGGGASSTVFGSRGAGSFLSKLTTASAAIFMATSLSLSYVWTSRSSDRLFDDVTQEETAPEQKPESLFEEVTPEQAEKSKSDSLLQEIGGETPTAPPSEAPTAAAPEAPNASAPEAPNASTPEAAHTATPQAPASSEPAASPPTP